MASFVAEYSSMSCGHPGAITNIDAPAYEDDREAAKAQEQKPTISIIEGRRLIRECLTMWLQTATGEHDVIGFSSIAEWEKSPVGHGSDDTVVLHYDGRGSRRATLSQIATLTGPDRKASLVVICDSEAPEDIVEAMNDGACGYIPTSVSLKVAIEAMRLIWAGGVYVPANSFLLRPNGGGGQPASDPRAMFTPRQSAVLEELQKGKANKIIAYELNMKESTVKVHIRNIMRKVGATNRTEVAILAYSLSRDTGPRG